VSTTVVGVEETSTRPDLAKAVEPSAPRVTTTIAGPVSSHRSATASAGSSGLSQSRSSSLTFTMSASPTSRSIRLATSSWSGSSGGRMLGSNETIADGASSRRSISTSSAPGASEAAIEPVCTALTPFGAVIRPGSQVTSKS
jgi:hypothetical protein